MRGVVVIEFWKKLCRNWCFVVYNGSRQLQLGLKSYVDILAWRTRARNVVYVQWRICFRCVTYDVKMPWGGWYISSLYTEEILVGIAIFVVKERRSGFLWYNFTTGAMFNNQLKSGVLFRVEVERQQCIYFGLQDSKTIYTLSVIHLSKITLSFMTFITFLNFTIILFHYLKFEMKILSMETRSRQKQKT